MANGPKKPEAPAKPNGKKPRDPLASLKSLSPKAKQLVQAEQASIQGQLGFQITPLQTVEVLIMRGARHGDSDPTLAVRVADLEEAVARLSTPPN